MFKADNETWEQAAKRRKLEVLEWRIDVLRKQRAIIKKRIKAVRAAVRNSQNLSKDEVYQLECVIDGLKVDRDIVTEKIANLSLD